MKEILPKDYHLQIVHDADDKSALFQREGGADAQAGDVRADKEIAFFEKQIMAIHHRLISKGYLPSLDAIRRAAEEVDGMFALGQFSADIPEFLQVRMPEYGERRVLAVEEVFCEMGLVTRDELRQMFDDGVAAAVQDDQGAVSSLDPEIAYTPRVETDAYIGPSYAVGDWVKVAAQTKPGHVRVPGYLLGKVGQIVQFQRMSLNPEEVAHFKETVVRLPLYLVEFDLEAVWGELCAERCKGDKMRVEVYEPWLTFHSEADV